MIGHKISFYGKLGIIIPKLSLLPILIWSTGWMDGWMDDLQIKSISKVFQSYQDDGQMILKGCVQWNPIYG